LKPGAFREPEPEAESSGGVPQGVQILAFLCGLLVVWLGFKSARQDWARIDKLTHLERYAETPGTFLKVKVRRDSLGSGDAWYPDVIYEYFVDGKSVWGWRLSYEEEPRDKAYWEGRLAAYDSGKAVTVYYDPALPKDAIVEKKRDSLLRIWLKLALGAAFLAAGLGLAGLSLSGWLRK
jgi:hypothetical protein